MSGSLKAKRNNARRPHNEAQKTIAKQKDKGVRFS
jgi:hypothetical protein